MAEGVYTMYLPFSIQPRLFTPLGQVAYSVPHSQSDAYYIWLFGCRRAAKQSLTGGAYRENKKKNKKLKNVKNKTAINNKYGWSLEPSGSRQLNQTAKTLWWLKYWT